MLTNRNTEPTANRGDAHAVVLHAAEQKSWIPNEIGTTAAASEQALTNVAQALSVLATCTAGWTN
jgi:hypothetical protein